MRSSTPPYAIVAGLFLLTTWVSAEALVIDGPSVREIDFQLLDPPVADSVVRSPAAPVSDSSGHAVALDWAMARQGATIAALGDALVIVDRDSGELLRVDGRERVAARLRINAGAAQLVVDADASRVYVSDRMSDRIVVVDARDSLAVASAFSTRTEPYGMALTRDGATLLVTSVADQQVSAYRLPAGRELWSIDIGPEPRGVTLSADDRHAAVTFLNHGTVARLSLRGDAPPLVHYTSLNRQKPVSVSVESFFGSSFNPAGDSILQPSVGGQSFARSAFTARYLRGGLLVVPHQESTPHRADVHEDTGVYGGSQDAAPVEHRLSFIASRANTVSQEGRVGQAAIGVHQPRALAYASRTDTLYVAGYGSDEIMALTDASTPSVGMAWRAKIQGAACGPTGMALAHDGTLVVFCELTRSIATVAVDQANRSASASMGPSLSKSSLSKSAQRGRALFRQGGNEALSMFGLLACTSCHPEVRADGLSWRIQGQRLQTPVLGGRVAGTHPFKWDGGDKTLDQSLRNTVTRLGGSGITTAQARDLQAFLLSVPRPRAPQARDRTAVARGKRLFHSARTGCSDCHRGPTFTDGNAHDLAQDLERVDTPSLVGLAVSAPYYHDGSAATLRAVLLENGSIHDMGNTDELRGDDIDDLIAYLRTL